VRSTLTIEVVAPGVNGGEVEIDGRGVGRAPLRVEITAGEHAFVVRAPGWVAGGRLARVALGETRVEVALEEDLVGKALAAGARGLRAGLDAASATAVLAAAATYAELDEVVLLGSTWRAGKGSVLAQRCLGGPIRCGPVMETRDVPTDKLAAAVDMILERTPTPGSARALEPILLEDTRMTEPEPPSNAPPADGDRTPGRPWWRNPWIWVGAGVAAVLVTGAWIVASDEGGGAEVIAPACLTDPAPCL
jgi:hypothetical protein